MRTAHCLTACCRHPTPPGAAGFRHSGMGMLATGFTAVVALVPASSAGASPVLDCLSAIAGVEAGEAETRQAPNSNASILVDVPIGKICVGPDSVEGEPSYVRRTIAPGGMAIVEVSATPFMPELGSNDGAGQLIARPDQPASW